MNSAGPETTTLDLVGAASGDLTPTERRIAEAVIAEPTLLAFGTVSDLAGRVGTSRPSIVRFANKLGFDGYTTLQQHVRDELSHQLARPSDRIRSESESRLPVRDKIDTAVATVFDVLESGQIEELAALLVRARNIWILSGETSQAGAHALRSGLSMIRHGVRSLDEHSVGTDLSDAGKGDVAIVIDFFRYRRQVVKAAQAFAKSGASVIAITDSALSPLVELADTWVQIKVPAVGPFDSSIPAVALSELLVRQVARDLHQEATDRIDRIEAHWEETETFLEA